MKYSSTIFSVLTLLVVQIFIMVFPDYLNIKEMTHQVREAFNVQRRNCAEAPLLEDYQDLCSNFV